MSYTALYRKFRPDNFEEVKGQDHIVTTLKNQIKAERIGHAYLFCGTRGTGKTTVAKIFAKAVNCENLQDGSPCNECDSCKAISAGASMNVIEIDAASNNGVDNIREIRDEVQYPPTEGKYKVYIIDEVHMLSIGAFNALLKTLEEPPSYVIFILATTEAHKIPVTILSRCQRYDFKRISVDTISDRLWELIEREGLKVEENAVKYIAKSADGALRDALSLLDQCMAFYIGEELTHEHVLEVLGAVDTSVFSQMLRAILAGDTVVAINKLDEIIMFGRDLSQFILDFTWYMRNLLLLQSSNDEPDIIDMSAERLAALSEEAKMTDSSTLMRYIRIMSELTNQLRYATSKRVLAEVAIIKMMKPAMENNQEALENRIANLEKQIEKGIVVQSNTPQEPRKADETIKQPVKKLDIAIEADVQNAVNNWNKILRSLSPLIKTVAEKAKVATQGGNRLALVFDSDIITSGVISRPETIEEIEKKIADEIGKEVKVEVKLLEKGEQVHDHFVEVFKNIKEVEIIEEDF